jgi:glycosyltransferase involved in cell wall biosynthesis
MDMTSIHIVYPHRDVPSVPDAIGRQLALALKNHGSVYWHEYNQIKRLIPRPGDVLIGHAYPCPFSTLRWSMRQSAWSRKILIQPFSLDEREHGHLRHVLDDCDLFLTITGDHWWRRISDSRFSPWLHKMRQIDLGLDRQQFPAIKTSFNPPGQRKLVYIGNDHPGKGLPELNAIARLLSVQVTWIGPKRPSGAGYDHLDSLGAMDWADEGTRRLLAGHDFLVMAGQFDACPVVVLEALSWGLIPVCASTTGYEELPGIVTIDAHLPAQAAATLARLQTFPESQLQALRRDGQALLAQRFTWERFRQQIVDAVVAPPVRADTTRDIAQPGWAAPYRPSPVHCAAALMRTVCGAQRWQSFNPWARR